MQAKEASEILDEIATFLELNNENPFKVRAIANAARLLKGMSSSLEELLESGELAKTKGIGKGILERLEEMAKHGHSPYLKKLSREFPSGLQDMLRVPRLGPKKVRILYDKLKIKNLNSLEKACKTGKLNSLKGFGEKTAENILHGIEFLKKYSDRILYSEVILQAKELENYLKNVKEIDEISIGGSLRRHLETVKDVDLVVGTKNPNKVMDALVKYKDVAEVTAKGETKTAVIFKSGLRVDLRAVKPKEFPYALHHFTGSKDHNTAMRSRAKSMGLKMNEYGLFRAEKNIACKNEKEIFAKLKLHYIPPELRENLGEIEEAEKHDFHDLITDKDIQGVLHVHSTYSDGVNTLEEMIEGAIKRNFKYIGFSDHSQSAFYANGLKVDRIKKQSEEIEKLREKYPKILILHGIESDILKNGDLDYPLKVLEKFDFIVGSIHGNFNLNEKEMTKRMIRAIKNPYCTMIGHPTGRLLLSREAYPINMEEVIEAAAENKKIIEINSHPLRFDLDWRLGPFARKLKIKTSINPDAHKIEDMDYMEMGVGIARKAGFKAKDVLNTFSVNEIKKYLASQKEK